MKNLVDCRSLDIDWDLAPEDAVTMYLEWGNNDWHAKNPPVRSRSDVSVYFVVDAWETPPVVRLIRRNSEKADELAALPLPDHLLADWKRDYGSLRGVFAPTPTIKKWLRELMDAV